jgi:hypothetical protein
MSSNPYCECFDSDSSCTCGLFDDDQRDLNEVSMQSTYGKDSETTLSTVHDLIDEKTHQHKTLETQAKDQQTKEAIAKDPSGDNSKYTKTGTCTSMDIQKDKAIIQSNEYVCGDREKLNSGGSEPKTEPESASNSDDAQYQVRSECAICSIDGFCGFCSKCKMETCHCGNVWDGNAQCDCYLFSVQFEQFENSN